MRATFIPRLAVWLARCFVLFILVGQGFVLELVETHDDITDCEDDDGEDCPCPPNCHCCLDCAHSGTAVLPISYDPRVESELTFIQLDRFPPGATLASRDVAPPPKVPKAS